MRYHLLQRVLAVLAHFQTVKGKGNTFPLLKLLEVMPGMQMLVTRKKLYDRQYVSQMVSVADLTLRLGKPKPTIVDHYVMTELLTGMAKLVEMQSIEIMRLLGGEISSDPKDACYSHMAKHMRVKVDGRHVDGCIYVNTVTGVVKAYKTNSRGQVILEDGRPIVHQLKGKEVHAYFSLE